MSGWSLYGEILIVFKAVAGSGKFLTLSFKLFGVIIWVADVKKLIALKRLRTPWTRLCGVLMWLSIQCINYLSHALTDLYGPLSHASVCPSARLFVR